jgi:hypothetical protein
LNSDRKRQYTHRSPQLKKKYAHRSERPKIFKGLGLKVFRN